MPKRKGVNGTKLLATLDAYFTISGKRFFRDGRSAHNSSLNQSFNHHLVPKRVAKLCIVQIDENEMSFTQATTRSLRPALHRVQFSATRCRNFHESTRSAGIASWDPTLRPWECPSPAHQRPITTRSATVLPAFDCTIISEVILSVLAFWQQRLKR